MKKIISTDKAPKAIGPYSQAVMAGDLLFISGQLPLVTGTSDFAGEEITAQTRQALTNLEAILEAAGLSMSHVVKTSVYLKDLNDFSEMNAVYGEFFPENSPARAAFEVARLPMNALVEIEAVALATERSEP
jgi:2-iminobutanoate/2-iminopropanoate deaminase